MSPARPAHPTRPAPPMLAVTAALLVALAGAATLVATPVQAQGDSAAAAATEAAYASALATFNKALAGDESAIEPALAQFRALAAADPAQPAWRAYQGAATSMQARTTLMPWKKMAFADDGLALIDKALAQLTPSHDTQRLGGVPASLLVRFTAAGTFNALPAMFNRAERGAKLMDDLLKSPLFAASPLGFRGTVWLSAADTAARAQRTEEARQWLTTLAASGAPQAAVAQARLKAL